ncbi:hypothetical protein MRB53_017948 [Persea americana]|uniref:Uncharacterized protein n=1 Tax=Persea americana TaxID=3435 RepID=A0ACC2M6N1_PERAE|nr:hypothetical protein MRB53_017948 [Persea americana]
MTQLAATDPTYNKWHATDCQVKSWLFDAMQPNQMKRFIRYDTAKQVWDAIKKTYSDGSDEVKIYDLHRRSFTKTHNGAPVANYYSELTEIFQELDQLSPSNMKDPADIETRHKEIDRLRIYIFLQKDGFTKGERGIRAEPHSHQLSHPKRLDQNLHQVHLAPRPWPPQDLLTRAVIGCGIRRRKLYYLDMTKDCYKRLGKANHVTGDESIRMKKIWLYPHQRSKLDPCALRCVFVGYSATQKGYKCFHPPTQTLHVTADVTFNESEFYYSGGDLEHPLQGESSIFAEDTQNQIIQIPHSVSDQPMSEHQP